MFVFRSGPCGAVCCSVLQSSSITCRLRLSAVRCSALQCVAVEYPHSRLPLGVVCTRRVCIFADIICVCVRAREHVCLLLQNGASLLFSTTFRVFFWSTTNKYFFLSRSALRAQDGDKNMYMHIYIHV